MSSDFDERAEALALQIEEQIEQNKERIRELPDFDYGRNIRRNEEARRAQQCIKTLQNAMENISND